ncbi:hypothetical protein L1987_29955 [Smallanthus sonchifolius]|uniref:Uncharacterized protein n=1 Tax=Smallanthus sonchifolius TaxID=185202 RepID=A0ACB9I295_9ASTR|nr:hypothetical protein L1987_29955 [Smallanthus sonchifolius]
MSSSSRTIDRFCKTCKDYGAYHDFRRLEELPLVTTQDRAFWFKVCSFCDSISSSDRSFNQFPALRSPSCLLDDNPSFLVESPNTFMFWDNHNPWEDELSLDFDYTPFNDEFRQDEINAIQNNK